MSFWENFVSCCNVKGESPNGVAKKLGISSGAVSAWKNLSRVPQQRIIMKIADYFGVSSSYLLGNDGIQSPDEALRVALFGGSEDVTDEMWEEVKRYAEYIKSKRNTNT